MLTSLSKGCLFITEIRTINQQKYILVVQQYQCSMSARFQVKLLPMQTQVQPLYHQTTRYFQHVVNYQNQVIYKLDASWLYSIIITVKGML